MWLQIRVYVVTIIVASFISLSLALYIQTMRLDNAKMQLAVINNDSKQQKEKAKEVTKVIKEIKWKTKERIRYVYSYRYDENKTDCANAISLLRNEF